MTKKTKKKSRKARARRERPVRYQESLAVVAPEFISIEEEMGCLDWVARNVKGYGPAMTPGGDLDPNNVVWVQYKIDTDWSGASELRRRVFKYAAEWFEPLDVDPFEVEHFEMHSSIYHHGGQRDWYSWRDGWRKIAWELHLSTPHQMFTGGALEFYDGKLFEPESRKLIAYDCKQRVRVKPVACYSSELAHGRVSIHGWIG